MASGPPAANTGLAESIVRFLLGSPKCAALVTDTFQKLKRHLRDFNVNSAAVLQDFLEDNPQIFSLYAYGGLTFVSVATTLTLCPEHCKLSGSCRHRRCAGLHLCKFFLLSGQCRHGNRCLFGHDLKIPHNLQLLREHGLDNLTITDLRAVFTIPSNRHGVLRPQVCRYYNVEMGCKKGRNCHSLHVCRRYVDGDCKFGKSCKRNHNITNDTQVDTLLTMYGVSMQRTPKEILEELRLYMTDDGDEGEYSEEEEDDEDDEDDDDDDDDDDAVAAAYPGRRQTERISGKPPKRFGSMPNLSRRRPLSLHNPQNNGAVPRQRYPSASRQRKRTQSGSQGNGQPLKKKEEICVYNLMDKCKFNPCMRIHSRERYEWRFTAWSEDGENATWRSLSHDSNVTLERDFCQPDICECRVEDVNGSNMQVNFKTFKALNSADGLVYKVKRLSMSSDQEPRGRSGNSQRAAMATVWRWYWRTKDQSWHEFGLERNGVARLPVTSEQLERHFLENCDVPCNVAQYVLNFNKMRLRDAQTGQNFKVRRRPQFTQQTPLDNPPSAHNSHAPTQDETARVASSATSWKSTKLNNSSKEFQEVKRKFVQTVGRAASIISIHKLENGQLRAAYEHQKKMMVSRTKKKKTAAERELYYCPASKGEDINFIVQHGIRCEPNLKRDTTLGKGGYFYANAGRADKFSGGRRLLFVADCLVGKLGQGDPHLVLPPPLDSRNPSAADLCDCCVDDLSNPKVFVIFNKAQVYAKYAVTFEYV